MNSLMTRREHLAILLAGAGGTLSCRNAPHVGPVRTMVVRHGTSLDRGAPKCDRLPPSHL